MPNSIVFYRPSAYYYRAELRAARTKAELLDVSQHLVCELEELKAWVRGHGLIPPRWFVTPSERREKAPGSVCPWPRTEAESERAE